MIHVVYPKGQQEEYKTTLHQLSLGGNIDSIDGILSFAFYLWSNLLKVAKNQQELLSRLQM